jgi:hypothetical protein
MTGSLCRHPLSQLFSCLCITAHLVCLVTGIKGCLQFGSVGSCGVLHQGMAGQLGRLGSCCTMLAWGPGRVIVVNGHLIHVCCVCLVALVVATGAWVL